MKKNYKSPVSNFVEIEIDSVMNSVSAGGGGDVSGNVGEGIEGDGAPNDKPFDAANNRGFGNLWENR
ncbi:MAG: hypothetical protein IKY37_04765 [Bacteroidaceae bacterium]|nr:hypothetical protein [Bacteroidaceae bacterium]